MGRYMMANFGHFLVLRSEVDLSDEQEEKLKDVGRKHRDEVPQMVSSVAVKFRGLRDAMLADNADEAAIRKAADDLGKAMGDAAVTASKGIGEAKAVLTPEQMASVRKFIASHDQSQDKLFEDMKKFKPRKRSEDKGDKSDKKDDR